MPIVLFLFLLLSPRFVWALESSSSALSIVGGSASISSSPSNSATFVGTGRTLTGGAGVEIAGSDSAQNLSADRTISLDSQEAAFLKDGGTTDLTCTSAQGSGSIQVMDSGVLQYCDGNGTPALQYGALADSSGRATALSNGDKGSFTCSSGTCSLDANSVGSSEITNDSIDSGDIASDAIQSSELANNSVGTGEITDGVITFADINSTQTIAGNPANGANSAWLGTTGLIFEGSTSDTIEGLLTTADPTTSDKTWTLPNATGTILTTGNITDITGLTDSQVSDTLTASNFVGSGSVGNEVDLGTAEVSGTLAVGNGGTGATSLNNLITLSTHTTGNYVATISAGTGITGSSSSEGGTPTIAVDTTANLTWTGNHDFSGGQIRIYSATTCSSTACDDASEAGRICYDSDATTQQRLFVCEGASGWKLSSAASATVYAPVFMVSDVSFSLTSGATKYMSMTGNTSATQGEMTNPIPAGTYTNLVCSVSSSQSNTVTITMQSGTCGSTINDSNLSVVASATANNATSADTDTLTISGANQCGVVKVVASGGAMTAGYVKCAMEKTA